MPVSVLLCGVGFVHFAISGGSSQQTGFPPNGDCKFSIYPGGIHSLIVATGVVCWLAQADKLLYTALDKTRQGGHYRLRRESAYFMQIHSAGMNSNLLE
ncbi:hypothetical protein J3F84DRAFT_61527 [Trichoderma pleuroticola]